MPASGLAYGVCGKCFRYESSNMADLRRLWDFTMREVVFLGGREEVLERRERSIEMMGRFLDEHRLAGEIRTASDPFFIAPDAVAKTYFQLSSETKYEISLMLPDDDRLAVGSHNYHTDFFGRAFNVDVEGGRADAQRLRRLRPGALGLRLPGPARRRPGPLARPGLRGPRVLRLRNGGRTRYRDRGGSGRRVVTWDYCEGSKSIPLLPEVGHRNRAASPQAVEENA